MPPKFPKPSIKLPGRLGQAFAQQLRADGSAGDFADLPLAARKITIKSAGDVSGPLSRGIEYYVSGDPRVRFYVDTQDGALNITGHARRADATNTMLEAAITLYSYYWDSGNSVPKWVRYIISNDLVDTTPTARLKVSARGEDDAGSVDVIFLNDDGSVHVPNGGLGIKDGITAPSTVSGIAQIYVDSADGDLKVKFGDGTVKTIVTDT